MDCFTRAGLQRVYATVDPRNAQSLAVIAKVGGTRRVSATDDEVYELPAPAGASR